jgi:hypothetical protein
MTAFNELLVITDPDQLAYTVDVSFASSTEEIVINTATKTISLKVQGNLTSNGVVFKAFYSKLKDAWRANATLIKFPFPCNPITDEQFEMVNGWNLDKVNTSGVATQNTVELLRTGGWSVVNTSGLITEQWTSVVTLGTLGSTDQVYFQQVNADQASVNFTLTGKVNQAVQVLSDPNGDGSYADGFDRRTYFKIFVREWQKLYAQSEIGDIGVSTLTYQAYRFPLTNSTDLKVTHTEVQIDANADGTPDVGVYANVTITYLRNSLGGFYTVKGDWVTATSYVIGDVVKGSNNRWYKATSAHTSAVGTQPITGGTYATVWSTFEGEREIGTGLWYPFTTIIDADTSVGPTISGSARTTEIYEAVQYKLRQNIDIDADGTGTVTGKTATALLRFVGDTLVTSSGVYVDSFNTQDTNSITFTDALAVARTFPYVAALTVNFGDNLKNDQYAKYWVFFTNAGGSLYGTTAAIIVNDKDSIPMTGDVNPAWPTTRSFVSHSFNYDSNVQGGRTAGVDAAVTAVGLGLSTGQYVSATSNIARSTANTVTLTSNFERNYAVGTVSP